MRDIEEVVEKVLGFDLIFYTFDATNYMNCDQIRKYFEIDEESDDTCIEHTPAEYTAEAVIRSMNRYLEFAWDKANSQRGISATRSMQHYLWWFTMLGEEFDEFAETLVDYEYYGKPQLWIITELLGKDPKEFDDMWWANTDLADESIPIEKINSYINKYKYAANFDELKEKFDSILNTQKGD